MKIKTNYTEFKGDLMIDHVFFVRERVSDKSFPEVCGQPFADLPVNKMMNKMKTRTNSCHLGAYNGRMGSARSASNVHGNVQCKERAR